MRRLAGSLACVALAFVACERVGNGAFVGPTPSPSVSPTGTASACNTTPTATIYVGIASSLSIADVAPYGEIAGYANVTEGEPLQAAAIDAHVGDTVQFENLDADGVTAHSAVALTATNGAFPATPYVFPATAGSPTVPATIGAAFWSTGLIPASTSGSACLSEAFSLPVAGTYYFGDLNFYNTITSFRDVIVVQ